MDTRSEFREKSFLVPEDQSSEAGFRREGLKSHLRSGGKRDEGLWDEMGED